MGNRMVWLIRFSKVRLLDLCKGYVPRGFTQVEYYLSQNSVQLNFLYLTHRKNLNTVNVVCTFLRHFGIWSYAVYIFVPSQTGSPLISYGMQNTIM